MQQQFWAKTLPLCVGVFILSIIIGYGVLAWTEPSVTPPGGNVAAPINTSINNQTKLGGLNIQGTFCVGNPASCKIAVQPTTCGTGQYVVAIQSDGTVTCSGGGPVTPPPVTPFNVPVTTACNNDLSAKNLRIFVTSSTYTGYNVSTVAKADTICQNTASAYGVPGTYKALMYYGDGTTRNPFDVLASDARYWIGSRPDETIANCTWKLVSNNAADFFTADGSGNYLENAISYNEKGLSTNNTVWTNFTPTGNGNWSGAPMNVCGSGDGCVGVCSYWNSDIYSRIGNSFAKNATWGGSDVNFGGYCSSSYCSNCMSQSRAIYCVQQRRSIDNVAGPCSASLPGLQKRIFVTSKTYTGYQVSTVSKADAICQSHAQNAGLPGTYKALMYYGDNTKRNPYDVLASGGAFWNCGSNGDLTNANSYNWNLIATSPAEFFTADANGNYLDNPIKFDEMGRPTNSALTVWTNFTPTGNGNWSGAPMNVCGSGDGCVGVCSYWNSDIYSRIGNSFAKNATWGGSDVNFGGYCSSSYCSNCMSQSRAIYCVQQ